VCFQDTLQWWKQGVTSAEFLKSIPANEVPQFFQSQQDKFAPDAIYRAKTWGRFQTEYQLGFVDLGLMPLVEEEVGRSLGTLIERNVSELKHRLNWENVDDKQGQWLLQTVFWLVSGKILRDKQVANFETLELNDVEEVFQRVGKHYGTKPIVIGSKKNLDALRESAHIISQFSSLVLTTTEALAYVYENTLISKETRAALGTHSTPSFLVDYVVGNLVDWIREIPVDERSVYEPACGHAAFLVSAMRLLTELLPADRAQPSKRGPYLRSRLHGIDIDQFALELARLSLTLTDIPNPNGWDLELHDMFLDKRLSDQTKKSTILLANPPFDNFSPAEQESYRGKKSEPHFVNKAAEMLWRTLPQLSEGGVFGIVLPQNFLHSDKCRDLREFLLREYELKEICLFPDKVFEFSDAESAVLIGRRERTAKEKYVRYRHIREREILSFRSSYSASSTRTVPQSRFSHHESFSLRVPDLEDVWAACRNNLTLGEVAEVAKGLDFSGSPPRGSITYSEKRFPNSHRGFIRFDRGLQLHQLPSQYWMNLDSSVVSSARSGTRIGVPQVLLNYAPASRGPWRLKGLVDKKGHPVTSRFIPIRSAGLSYSIETLWAILNSPVANAYVFSHLGKRDNIVGDIRKIPMPQENSAGAVEHASNMYLQAASAGADSAILQKLLMQVDCEVLRLYSFPLKIEQSILTLFTNWQRVGVPFQQSGFMPDELSGKLHFHDFVEFEKDWLITNRERGLLIDKDIAGRLTSGEKVRLEALQVYADYHIDKVSSRPSPILDELEDKLFLSISKKG
jgi:hypothetical protein